LDLKKQPAGPTLKQIGVGLLT